MVLKKGNLEVVSLGIPKLDKILMPGIPKGYTIVCKGTPGSGAELFAKQFASGAGKDEKVVYITTEEKTAEVRHIMEKFSWDHSRMQITDIATGYFEKVLSKELEVAKSRREGLSIRDISSLTADQSSTIMEEADFLAEMVYDISRLEPPYRVIVDSLDFFLTHYEHHEVISAVQTIKAHTSYNKGVTLLSMTKGVHPKDVENSIDVIADCIIELNIKQMASEFETSMVVTKVRNYPDKVSILTYAITEQGITPELVSRVA